MNNGLKDSQSTNLSNSVLVKQNRPTLNIALFMQKTISHYAVVLTELAERNGLDVDKLISDIGLPEEYLNSNNQWIDNGFATKMVKELWHKGGDEFFGLSPEISRMGSWALACQHMLIAETLGELYRLGENVLSFIPPNSMGIDYSVNQNDVRIDIRCYQGERDTRRFLTEFICVTWHRFPCWAIDQYIPLKRARFSYPAPSHHWFYEELFQCPIEFDQATTGFEFDKKFLGEPICRNRSELADWLRDSPADMLYMPGRDNTIANHVRRQLDVGLRENMHFPSFDKICAELSMSSQVVRRRLSEEGEHYQNLKDSVRSSLVKELLTNSDLPLAEITHRSGFNEIASLSRAFKKWTDMSPAEYRKANAPM